MSLNNFFKCAVYFSAKAAGEKVSFSESEEQTNKRGAPNHITVVRFKVGKNDYMMKIRYQILKTGRWPEYIKLFNETEHRKIVTRIEFEEVHRSIANPEAKEAVVVSINKRSKYRNNEYTSSIKTKPKTRLSLKEILGEEQYMLTRRKVDEPIAKQSL